MIKETLKIGIMLAMITAWFNTVAQTPIQQKKAEFYAEEAVKYFKLDESKKEAIYEAKLGLIQAQKVMSDKKKSGDLIDEDEELYRKYNIAPHSKKVMEAIGVKWAELKPFNAKVHPEMNKIRS